MMLRAPSPPELGDRIAIVGMGCILPGGIDSPQTLWDFLWAGREAMTDVPADRWNVDAIYDPVPGTAGKTPVRRGAFLDSISDFDPAFFNLSPREAAVMDPQQRLLLEAAWRALEDAGIPPERLAGSSTGVYVGISHSDYHAIQKFGRRQIDVHTATGGALSIAAARLSHMFDLHGRALAVDTACSSSLVALDLACSDLLRGECEMALVGGVNAILTPDVTITFSRASMLAPDGRCKAFDARANGYVRGEGVGVVALKPLSRARLDGDRIHAVIASTAVNQDGRTSTITVPSLDAQIAMLRDACRKADVDPGCVAYVEAHGTGTPVGDPIEARAIGTVFGADRPLDRPCLIGSIKTNIGHLEPAAGVVGLIKAALCIRHGAIPASLNFERPNPNIDFEGLGIAVARSNVSWDFGEPRIAAVNSFGFGGTNACAILVQSERIEAEAAPAVDCQRPVLLGVSGASEKARASACGAVANALREGAAVADVAGTLASRRSHLDRRCVVPARSRDQAIAMLEAIARGDEVDGAICGRRSGPHRLAFVFTGQGAQWAGMGRGLFDHDAVFRRSIQQCDALFQPLAGWSVAEALLDQDSGVFDRTSIAQPATFAVQVGLAASLAAIGVKPECVIGHSIGEIAAAYVCGALSLADAVQVVFHRSRLQERTRFMGGMAAVGLSAEAAKARIADFADKVEVAAINGPELITVAGEKAALTHFVDRLREESDDIFCQFLRVDYAFHTVQMDPFRDELRASLADLRPRVLRIPMISTVTGSPIEDVELNADYWCANMREPVLFKAAVHRAIDYGLTAFVELGPHHALSSSVKACMAERGTAGLVVATLRRDAPDQNSLEQVFSTLHVNGVDVDWKAVTPPGWKFVELPGASFERISCWAESEESRHARFDGPAHPLLGTRLTSAKAAWQSEIDAHTPRYLADHRVESSALFPASGYVELMLAAARETFGDAPWEIEQLAFHEALSLGDEGILVETAVNWPTGSVEIRSRARGGAEWTLRASGVIRSWQIPDPVLDPWLPDPQPPLYVGRTRFYRELAREGHDFGPAFQGVDTVWGERNEALGRVTVPESAGELSGYILHPALLDACFQVIRAFQGFEHPSDGVSIAIPSGIDSVRLFRRPGRTVFSRVTKAHSTDDEIIADLQVLDESGALAATISGFRCQRIRRQRQTGTEVRTLLLEETWTELSPVDRVDPNATIGTWLLVGRHGDIATQLGALLQANGGRCILAPSALTHEGAEAIRDVINAADDVRGIVYLNAHDEGAAPAASQLERTWERESAALLALIRSLKNMEKKPRLHVVTTGGVLLGRNDPASDEPLLLAPLTGMLRTIGNELPDFCPILIDLDPKNASASALYQEIMGRSTESEIALRGARRFGSRLRHVSLHSLPKRRVAHDGRAHSRAFRLSMTAPGIIDNLQLVEDGDPKIGAGEVLIEVAAVGLNFRDVMAATGLLPAQAEQGAAWQRLGIECAGNVIAVGEGGDPDLIGRRVAAFAPGCFASHVCVSQDMVFVLPQTMSFADAAAIPVALATAHYALTTCGRLSSGERVLIHGAAGGVGLAAVTIAQACGAEVFATAGTPEKRALLNDLGVKHVFDSRTLAFFDDVMAATGGKGVDVVLNSLSGPFLERSMKAMSAGGRFLEIGKRDVYANTAIGLHALRQNASLFVIDLARLAVERPQVLRAEIEAVIGALQRGEFRNLPVQCFPIGEVADAFHHMASAKHIGKVVVTLDGPVEIVCATKPTFQAASDGAYLITGGTSGLGLATAQWLAQRGARKLVVLGRNAPRPEALEALAALRADGATVDVVAVDVSNRRELAKVLAEIARTRGPLRGVVHAAGVIDDAFIDNLAQDKVMRVFEGKVAGAWNLHELTKTWSLDFFVMFSSIAESIGTIGQAHYAAANRSLHALARLRHGDSLPALAISLGPVSDCGHLMQRPELASYMSGSGVRPMPMARLLEELNGLLQTDACSIACADIDWAALARSHQAIGRSARTIELLSDGGGLRTRGGTLSTMIHAASPQQRAEIVSSYLRRQIAGILKSKEDAVDTQRPLNELGLDSLTSFELKNRVETDFGFALPIGKFVQRPTIAAIATAIMEKFDQVSTAGETATGCANSAELAMSPGQKAIWFIDQIGSGGVAYCLTMAVSVQPKLDRALADQALRNVVARHDALRMAFSADSYGPIPFLLDVDDIRIKWHDAAGFDRLTLQRALDGIAGTPFMLSNGPLIQVHVFERPGSDILLLHLHHIIADAASISIVIEELFETYVRLRGGVAAPAQAPLAHYAAFAEWQAALVEGPEGQAHRAYWQAQLADGPSHLSLKTDRERVSRHGSGAAFRFKLAHHLVSPLKELAQSEGTTLFCVLLAAFNILLHREAGNADIIVGTPTTGRTRPEFERMVGYLVNAVPIRTRLSASDSCRTLLTKTSSTVRGALEHQDYPFSAIVQDAGIARDADHPALFQVMFSMERAAAIDASGFSVTLLNTKGPQLRIHDMSISALELKRERPQFDLAFAVEEFDGQVLGVVDYRSDLWDESSIGRIADQYQDILELFARAPDRPLVPERPASRRESVLTGPVVCDVPDVADAVRAAAAAHAHRCAVIAVDGQYTYAEIVGRAQAIASALIVNGVEPGAIVALHLERGRDLPAAMLGALMARVTYVPLDPGYPRSRILQILTSTAPALVMVQGASELSPTADVRTLNLDTIGPSSQSSWSTPRSDDIVYVIHTSGSTGVPAGVEVTRGALSNVLAGMTKVVPLSPDDRLLAITTPAFDIAVLELLLPLTLGASVVVDDGSARDGRRLAARLAKGDITVMQATPATWQMLLDAGWNGDLHLKALCGGEALPRDLARALTARAGRLWNLYGPTETTIWSTAAEISDSAAISIGWPIANTQCRIVNERLERVSPGESGELLIGGVGLAWGYRGDPSRTAERFIPDPDAPASGGRLFRTGDLVRQREDGAIIHLGRNDRQIKLRGVRIEPEEIEVALRALEPVHDAAVVMVGATVAQRRLVAFVTCDRAGSFSPQSALQALRATLPSAMVPNALHVLDALPRLPNGKLDHQQLLSQAEQYGRSEHGSRAADDVEARLLSILADSLDRKDIGVDDDFFFAGGTSLLAMRYLARASEAFGVDIEVSDLLRGPTVALMAVRVRELVRATVRHGKVEHTAYRPPWKPLALARAEGAFAPCTASAIAYLPDDLAKASGFSRTMRMMAGAPRQNDRSHWAAVCQTAIGSVALITIPRFGRDLLARSEPLVPLLQEAILHARRIGGGQAIAMTGILPAMTELCTDLAPHDGTITTGHSTTACAMVLSIRDAIRAAKRDLRDEVVAFVGLGAIGTATLRLMLDKLPTPQRIILCDVPAKRVELESIAREIEERHCGSAQCIASAGGSVPAEVYHATLIVGATNVTDLIAIDQLRPGTILIDDSFPHCFDLADALERIERAGDVLIAAGGRVAVPGAMTWHVAAPPGVTGFISSAIARELSLANGTITGCILSSLLTAAHGAPATVGPTTLASSRAHWDILDRLNARAAPLHCGPLVYAGEWMKEFSERFEAQAHVL